ncbi:MAG: DUF1127 domain-containing protein [Pseudomonadota bacterium]
MFTELLESFNRRQARARAIATLKGMTDRQLNDLGIHRSQIRAYVDGER